MKTRVIPCMVLCAFLIAGCETSLLPIVPEPGAPAATTGETKRSTITVASEFRPAPEASLKELNTCKEALAMAQARMAELKKTVEELQQANRQERRRAEDLQFQTQESEQELTRRKAALADTARHLTTLEQDKQKTALALSEAQGRLQQLAAGLAAEQGRTATLSDENKRLSQSLESMKKSLEGEIEKRNILIRESRGRLVITMLDRLLFDSGQTTIKPSALKSLSEVSTMLKQVTDKEIRVEGHTDNRPIHGSLARRFPTNWELSTARAISVVRYLVDNAGVDPAQLSAGGHADTRPVAKNDTEEGRSQNRRIEIVLYPKAAPPSAAKPD